MPAQIEFHDALNTTYPNLWRFCLARTKDRDVAEDLAQTTCLRALEKKSQFEQGSRLDLWLFKMAHRLWLNDLRAQKVRRGQGLVPVEETGLTDDKPDQISNFFAHEVLNKVMMLPEAQRVTVTLVYVEGFKYAEAAEILDIPIGTVMSRLAAARATLAQELKDT